MIKNDDTTTYLLKNKMSLLYFAVLSERDDLVPEVFERSRYNEDHYSEEFHPVKLALKMDNYKLLDVLGKYFMNHEGLLNVTEDMLLQALRCSSDMFKEAVIAQLFKYELKEEMVPNTIRGKDSHFPLSFTCSNRDIEEE